MTKTLADAQDPDTWDTLHAAAVTLLATAPLDRFSMRAVARRAGYRLATLQHYFPRKADLIEAVLGDVYGRIMQLLDDHQAALADADDLEAVVAELMVELYRLAREHRHLCRIRMVTNLLADHMSRSSVQHLVAAAHHVEDALPVAASPHELRLGIHSLSVLVLRYAAHPPEELQALLGTPTTGEASLRVERHIAEVARHMTRRACAGRAPGGGGAP